MTVEEAIAELQKLDPLYELVISRPRYTTSGEEWSDVPVEEFIEFTEKKRVLVF